MSLFSSRKFGPDTCHKNVAWRLQDSIRLNPANKCPIAGVVLTDDADDDDDDDTKKKLSFGYISAKRSLVHC